MGKCKCYDLPPDGEFIKGKIYDYFYVIDGIYVIDENKRQIDFHREIYFLWFFIKV